jgi:micrococcal nuclease
LFQPTAEPAFEQHDPETSADVSAKTHHRHRNDSMKPASTDSILTLFASLLVGVLLFVGRTVIENRGDSFAPNRHGTDTTQRDAPKLDDLASTPSIDWAQQTPDEFAQQPAFSAEKSTASRPTQPPATADPLTARTFKVIGIVDGDTIDVLVDQKPVRLRLNGIDTPEKGQPFGNTATDSLKTLIGDKFVRYVVSDSNRYDRSIADVYLGDVYVNLWLVKQGLAWHYVAYSDDPQLAAAEEAAKAEKRGLFADPRRVAPWNWRQLSKLERDEIR